MTGAAPQRPRTGWNPRAFDREWPFELFATEVRLDPDHTALLIVDVQAADMEVAADSDLGRGYPAIRAYWNTRLGTVVMPAIRELVAGFRDRGLPVVYTRNGPITPHAGETTARLRPKIGPAYRHRGSPGYEIEESIAPLPGDVVVDKLTSGAFTGTYLDHALRNLGVTGLVVVGVVTDMCVLGTARAAAELGYWTVICEDGCGGYTERAHNEALLAHARVFGRVSTADEISSELGLAGLAAAGAPPAMAARGASL